MAKNMMKRAAKRANKPNPREDRNNVIQFDFDHKNDNQKPKPRKRIELLPRNLEQETYIDSLTDMTNHIVFAMGPAGCGKTLLATLYAIRGYQVGEFDKIIITRPAVSVDEQHGFLPGGVLEKMTPWVLPILDVFKEHFTPAQVEKMIIDEVIEIAPLAYMRGRTLKRSIILADEMQNATQSQMKMLLTRIGEGSRMVVTGDLAQHDRGYEENGLKHFVERLEAFSATKGISVNRFTNKSVERHPVIGQILKIYGDE